MVGAFFVLPCCEDKNASDFTKASYEIVVTPAVSWGFTSRDIIIENNGVLKGTSRIPWNTAFSSANVSVQVYFNDATTPMEKSSLFPKWKYGEKIRLNLLTSTSARKTRVIITVAAILDNGDSVDQSKEFTLDKNLP